MTELNTIVNGPADGLEDRVDAVEAGQENNSARLAVVESQQNSTALVVANHETRITSLENGVPTSDIPQFANTAAGVEGVANGELFFVFETAGAHVYRRNGAVAEHYEWLTKIAPTARTASLANALSTFDNGDVAMMAGLPYKVDSAAVDAASGNVTSDLAAPGLTAYFPTGEVSTDFFGIAGNSTDESTRLNEAMDYAAGRSLDVVIPATKTIGLASTVDIPYGTELRGGSGRWRPHLLDLSKVPGVIALSGIGSNPLFTMAHGDDHNTTRRSHSLRGIRLNGNNLATVGVSIRNAVQSQVMGCHFSSFATGGAGIRGGGNLYTYIERNSFVSGLYYALDFMDGYKGGSAHYYGVNVGKFADNLVSSSYGIRYEGTFDVLGNDFEFKSESGTAIMVASTYPSYTNIRLNYFEILTPITNPGAGQTLIDLGSAINNATITGNFLYGDVTYAGSLGIDLTGLTAGAVDIHGNFFGDLQNGISYPSTGSALFDVGVQYYRPDVTNKSVGRRERQNITSALSTAGAYGRHVQGGAQHFIGGTTFGAVNTFNNAGINLDHGTVFYLADFTGTATYSSVVNPRQGQIFTVQKTAATGSVVLPNSVFNLACGADLTLPRDKPLMFQVDESNTVREVGVQSRALWSGTVSQLPSAATLGAGARLQATDANATTFASVVAGGGANAVPVYSDGTAWRIG